MVLGRATAPLVGTIIPTLASAARVDDIDDVSFLGIATLTGTFRVAYDAVSGDVTVGAGSFSDTFAGIQNRWDDGPLMVSFFLRSDSTLDQFSGNAWDGTATAVFRNFSIDSGRPISVPEPSSFALLAVISAVCLGLRFRAPLFR